MKKIKVVTVIGTRPEIIRLSETIKVLDKLTNHVLVHTGQNYDYELNEVFFKDLHLRKPDYFLNSAAKTATKTIAKILDSIEDILIKEKPEAMLVLGDTNSCVSIYAAKRLKIPTFHMEAGNRCFDQRVPEEINRKLVDHISDVNLTYSNIAREYLISEGFPSDRIIKTGSPMYEVISNNFDKINESTILDKLNLKQDGYIVVSAHREENIDNKIRLKELIVGIERISNKFKAPVIFSTHPRTRKNLKRFKIQSSPNIILAKPFGFHDYLKLQIESKIVLSDSGTINEEASILNFNAINIRENHERPEAMEEAITMMSGISSHRLVQCVELTLNQKKHNLLNLNSVEDYMKPNVSRKVVRIILGYVDYVNRVVWKKY